MAQAMYHMQEFLSGTVASPGGNWQPVQPSTATKAIDATTQHAAAPAPMRSSVKDLHLPPFPSEVEQVREEESVGDPAEHDPTVGPLLSSLEALRRSLEKGHEEKPKEEVVPEPLSSPIRHSCEGYRRAAASCEARRRETIAKRRGEAIARLKETALARQEQRRERRAAQPDPVEDQIAPAIEDVDAELVVEREIVEPSAPAPASEVASPALPRQLSPTLDLLTPIQRSPTQSPPDSPPRSPQVFTSAGGGGTLALALVRGAGVRRRLSSAVGRGLVAEVRDIRTVLRDFESEGGSSSEMIARQLRSELARKHAALAAWAANGARPTLAVSVRSRADGGGTPGLVVSGATQRRRALREASANSGGGPEMKKTPVRSKFHQPRQATPPKPTTPPELQKSAEKGTGQGQEEETSPAPKEYLKRRTQRVQIGRKVDYSLVKSRTDCHLRRSYEPRPISVDELYRERSRMTRSSASSVRSSTQRPRSGERTGVRSSREQEHEQKQKEQREEERTRLRRREQGGTTHFSRRDPPPPLPHEPVYASYESLAAIEQEQARAQVAVAEEAAAAAEEEEEEGWEWQAGAFDAPAPEHFLEPRPLSPRARLDMTDITFVEESMVMAEKLLQLRDMLSAAEKRAKPANLEALFPRKESHEHARVARLAWDGQSFRT